MGNSFEQPKIDSLKTHSDGMAFTPHHVASFQIVLRFIKFSNAVTSTIMIESIKMVTEYNVKFKM